VGVLKQVAKRPEKPQCDTYVLTREEFDALPEYSCSIPTGTTIGKEWKRRKEYKSSCDEWSMGEYVEIGKKDRVGIAWADIEIEENKNARA